MNSAYNPPEFRAGFEQFLLRSVPRLLTQLDRDPDSPTFGCFDRDFWHYRMRDFSSIVLQQGAIILETLYRYPHPDNFLFHEPKVVLWVDGALSFWAAQQLPCGAFNEYYPFEEGFPPTAFSLLSVGLILQERGFPKLPPALARAVQKAADWLLANREGQALNQQAAALVALALVARLPDVGVDPLRLEAELEAFFRAQSVEGWFPEYGGADTGYLSVTLDALAVYHDLTSDPRAAAAMERALEYLSLMIAVSASTPVMTNSRNTDYIAPYGLIRMAGQSPLAARIVQVLFRDPERPLHFLNATDDRYLCHYLYQSCFRGLEQLPRMSGETGRLPCETGAQRYFCEAGIYLHHVPGRRSIFTAAGKGGIYYIYAPEGLLCADFGWRFRCSDTRIALTHWQHPENRAAFGQEDGVVTVESRGAVSVHGWLLATPLRHFALRIFGYLLGRRLISRLKEKMIFRAESSGISYCRKVTITADGLRCSDSFSGRGLGSFVPVPAPAHSLRHVASSGNFHGEELSLPLLPVRSQERTKDSLVITSRVDFPEAGR